MNIDFIKMLNKALSKGLTIELKSKNEMEDV
jgi:hypothetical protein